ncbi:hypothetical protein JHK84_047414 [Glycine max]|nr:hypothetical protein JHK86_047394 [Glycine max]KAG4943336.1 hypothetical protein JHK85_047982 [Glycine max]KAG5102445.1 hypothetical protein JHK84_047414 [Glycine max]
MEDIVDHLAFERNKTQFDVDEMKIAGSLHAFEVSDKMARLVASDPVDSSFSLSLSLFNFVHSVVTFFEMLELRVYADLEQKLTALYHHHSSYFAFRKDDRVVLDRKALFMNTLRKTAYAWKRIIELRLSEEEAAMLRSFVDQPAFTDLHWGMFVPTIKGQGTEEQQQKWLPLAHKMQIIGCYAQTELGHGSNVQGLEKTATFDPKTDEFVIHSPTLTSSKVRYLLAITEYDFNSFDADLNSGGLVDWVSLSSCERSLDDHLPLPGITVGDIGMKFGNGAYNSMDNGVLRFDCVWIPRNQMLMRVSQVTREGKYVQSSVPRQLVYGTMVNVRQTIVSDASIALSRAVCIATRYSAVRRQFGSKKGGLETQVIDYKTQQARLIPLLASAYAFRFVGEWLKWLYMDVMKRLQTSDFSTLPEAHACTAGLKSFTTSATADGIEECRKLCGGHGYLCSSGLPELFAVYIPSCTYEGDNTVLLLQVARHLIKTISQLGSRKKPVGTTSYIGRVEQLMQYHSDFQKAEDGLKPNAVLGAFEARAAKKVIGCAQNLSKFTNPEEGFQEFSVDLVEAAVAHCQLIVVSKGARSRNNFVMHSKITYNCTVDPGESYELLSI